MVQSADRVLHVWNEHTQSAIDRVREWAKMNNIGKKFEDALDYLRTFSGGPERDWKSTICTDMFFNESKPCFIATIYRRRRDVQTAPDLVTMVQCEKLVPYMTIGMMYDDKEMNWSFHS